MSLLALSNPGVDARRIETAVCATRPFVIRRLLEAGHPAAALAYYRGGMHDWVTLALPTQPRED